MSQVKKKFPRREGKPASKERAERPARPHRDVRPSSGPRKGNRTEDERFRDYLIWGRHPVEATIAQFKNEAFDKKTVSLHVLLETSGKVPGSAADLAQSCEMLGVKVFKYRSAAEGWPLGEDSDVNHQRVCVRMPSFPTKTLSDVERICRIAKQQKLKGCVGVILDQVQDPRNFGAVVRSAAFFGAKFVVYAQNRQAELSPLVVRTSAGGAFAIDFVPVVNIARTLDALKEFGVWVVGTHVQNATPLESVPVDRPFVVVVGNEHKGQRTEVTKQCDIVTSIPGGSGTVDSLNVSVAAGILLSHFSLKKTLDA